MNMKNIDLFDDIIIIGACIVLEYEIIKQVLYNLIGSLTPIKLNHIWRDGKWIS